MLCLLVEDVPVSSLGAYSLPAYLHTVGGFEMADAETVLLLLEALENNTDLYHLEIRVGKRGSFQLSEGVMEMLAELLTHHPLRTVVVCGSFLPPFFGACARKLELNNFPFHFFLHPVVDERGAAGPYSARMPSVSSSGIHAFLAELL